MKKILAIITLILPLLLSQNSWGSSLPECKLSPVLINDIDSLNNQEREEVLLKLEELLKWDNCQGSASLNGEKYTGEFKDGKSHGQGTRTTPNGEKYVGEFKDDKRNGQGTYTFPDGEQYVGEWKDDKRHGQGTYTYPDGAKYVGESKDGLPNGLGTFTFPDGAKYVGEYKDGLMNGQGTFTFPDGRKDEGIYKDGKFLYENIVTSKDDENFCLEIGFKRFTPEFDNCVEKTAEKD
jgi:hypothetical protein